MLYVIQAETGGPVKIGYTQDDRRLRQRLRNLQAGNHKKLRVVAAVNGAGPTSEARLCATLEQHSIRGGWFKPAGDVKSFIEAAQADPDLDILRWCKRLNHRRRRKS